MRLKLKLQTRRGLKRAANVLSENECQAPIQRGKSGDTLPVLGDSALGYAEERSLFETGTAYNSLHAFTALLCTTQCGIGCVVSTVMLGISVCSNSFFGDGLDPDSKSPSDSSEGS